MRNEAKMTSRVLAWATDWKMLPFPEMMKTTGGIGLKGKNKNIDVVILSCTWLLDMQEKAREEVRAGNNLEFKQTWTKI